MLKGLGKWIDGLNHSNSPEKADYIEQIDDDIYLCDEELGRIHHRIRHCLDDDKDYIPSEEKEGIEDTLRLMHEETERWGNTRAPYREERRNYIPEAYSEQNIEHELRNSDDELISYCMRLERNNAYLLQFIEKFEEVSFKKRYSKLLLDKEELERNYEKLKSTNKKVYSSYCDLLDEVKLLKKANQEYKGKLQNESNERKLEKAEVEKLKAAVVRLESENQEKDQRLKQLRFDNSKLSKTVSDKEDEMIKLRGSALATKMKLERAERLINKREGQPKLQKSSQIISSGTSTVNSVDTKPLEEYGESAVRKERLNPRRAEPPKKGEEEEEEEEDKDEVEDTISLLEKKYSNKTKQPSL